MSSGKVIAITGASSWIGAEIARHLAGGGTTISSEPTLEPLCP